MSGANQPERLWQELRAELPAEAILDAQVDDARPVVAPRDVEQWRAFLRLAREGSWKIGVQGLGSTRANPLDPGNPAGLPAIDVLASTRNHRGVTAYEPGDGTLTARTGTPLAELENTVAGGGHHLSPAVAQPERRTLGGVLGTGESGHERMRFGPLRHQVLGMQVMLADGSLAKTGGALVKNVTGYDLHRLYCGSRGSLCVILEASLRLYPLPDRRCVLRAEHATRHAAWDAARRALAASVRPWSVFVQGNSPGPWRTTVYLAGRAEVLDWELDELAPIFPGARPEDVTSFERFDGAYERRWLAPPSRMDSFLNALDEDTALRGIELLAEPGEAITRLRRAGPGGVGWEALDELAAQHGIVTAAHTPGPAEQNWIERLKRALDPERRFPQPGAVHG